MYNAIALCHSWAQLQQRGSLSDTRPQHTITSKINSKHLRSFWSRDWVMRLWRLAVVGPQTIPTCCSASLLCPEVSSNWSLGRFPPYIFCPHIELTTHLAVVCKIVKCFVCPIFCSQCRPSFLSSPVWRSGAEEDACCTGGKVTAVSGPSHSPTFSFSSQTHLITDTGSLNALLPMTDWAAQCVVSLPDFR